MKYRVLYLLLTLLFSTALWAADRKVSTSDNSINWIPIVGIKNQNIKMYFDQQSYIRVYDNEGNYTKGDILLVFQQPTEMLLHGKSVSAKSMVKSIIVNCKTAVASSIVDYYFSVEAPQKSDVALGYIKYNVEATAEQISKKSSLFITFCSRQV